MNPDFKPLSQIADNLWEIERPLQAPGLRINHRMTVAKTRKDELWVHSPVQLDPTLEQALANLGTVRHLIAPSCYHDLYWPAWLARYPDASFFCPPGFPEAHRHVQYGYLLTPDSNENWEDELPKVFIAGMPKLNEFVFLHRASRTLIVADLVFHLDVQRQHGLGKLFLKLNGIYGRVACSRIFKSFIKDRAAFRASIDQVLELDFDRLVLGRGANIPAHAKEGLRSAMAWLDA